MDQFSLITGLQVPEDGGVVEVGQVDHVLALLKLGGVDATNLASLQGELLVTDGDGHLHGEVSALRSECANLTRLEETLLVAVGLGVHDPNGLLGIVGLRGEQYHLDVHSNDTTRQHHRTAVQDDTIRRQE